MNLRPHPRLFITAAQYEQLKTAPGTPLLQETARRVGALAEEFLRDTTITVDETSHNWHLLRARQMQVRVFTLLVEWKRTGERRFRDALLADVRRMAQWEYWSWIAWRHQDPAPEAIYDLSYGENATTLALAFDAMRGELSAEEVALFAETAGRRALRPYLSIIEEQTPGWYRSPNSNWNTVCNGGAGLLALALAEECPEAEEVLRRVEYGVQPYFESLGQEGAWPEGLGYWSYGMRYGYIYLLSHESATGRTHPLLELPGSTATLSFPLDFSPCGVACGFGDANGFSPLPFHLAAAQRLGRADVVAELLRRFALVMAGEPNRRTSWALEAELLLLAPRPAAAGETASEATPWPDQKFYSEMEWGYVTDQMPVPNLYVSARGGTIDAPHTHRDLLSFYCLVRGEKLIENVPVDDYIDTTFSPRREELYEVSPLSKNSIFVNGVGIATKTSASTTPVRGDGYSGFRFDATEAMGQMRDGSNAAFCGRAILLLEGQAVLILDRVELAFAGLVESRLHTFCDVDFSEEAVRVSGEKNWLHIAFASTQPALVKPGLGLPTSPQRKPDNIIRHVSAQKVFAITLCQLLAPNRECTVQLVENGERTRVAVSGGFAFALECGPRLDCGVA
jgi:hypothetical protein